MATSAAAGTFERRFERLDASLGVSANETTAIAQDQQGFVWIGTTEGLNRFDGLRVRVFRRGAGGSQGLASNRISALLVTRDGTLWVGTQGGGLSRYDPDTESFTTFRHHPEDAASLGQDDVAHLAEDGWGRLWIATFRGGLSLLEDPRPTVTPVFRRLVHRPDDPDSLADDRTRAVLADRFGEIWVATMSGVDRVVRDPRRGDISFAFSHTRNRADDPTSLPDDEVWSLCRDRDGDLWVGMWWGAGAGFGLARARLPTGGPIPDRLAFDRFREGDAPTELADDRVLHLREDGRGTIWIGTAGGLHEVTPAERDGTAPRFVRHLHDRAWPFSLPGDSIGGLFEDSDGDLWVATDSGVGRLDRSREGILTLRVGPPDDAGLSDAVNDAWIDRQGVLWVATQGGLDRVERTAAGFGIERFQADPERTGSPGILPVPAPLTIEETVDGWLWMTSYQWLVGLPPSREDPSAPRFLHLREGLSSNAVLAVHEDRSGALWAGTYRGLHRIRRDPRGHPTAVETWRHDDADPRSLSSQSVSALASAPDGTLWVGTYVGLNRFDPATGQATRYLPSATGGSALGHEFVTSLAFDPAGALWIGTRGGGLDRLDPASGRFRHFGIDEGLPSENVSSVAADTEGRIWFTSPRGLVRLDPGTGAVRVFDHLDGLPDDEVSLLRIARDGTLLVGTAAGLTLVPPAALDASGRAPPIVLTGLRIGNQRLPVGPESRLAHALDQTPALVLHHDDYLVTFELAAISFRRASRSRFRYRLEGLGEDWIEVAAGDAKATFSTLPPGEYVLRVVGANGDGAWNETGASLAIRVLPPWYLTWWARSGMAVILLGAVAAMPLLRLRRVRRLNVLLEARVEERTAELVVANRKLAEAARTDFLTGLPNRRELLECIERERIRQQRTGKALALAIADVDGFKAINDRRGHDCGDFVLVELARQLRSVVREQDVVARWGGEELLILFPETDLDGALVVTEKARRAVADHHFVWTGERVPVTLTVGVVEVPPGQSIDAAISAADAALYEGKRAGKNRVVAARPCT